MSAPSDRLREHAAALAARVQREMYADAFWIERFGARGEAYAREDGQKHVLYLADALAFGDRAVFRDYAVWLRSVLTSRGMCTRHLDDNFARLGDAIADLGLDADGAARACLDDARAALLRPPGTPARAVEDAAEGMAARAGGERSRVLDHLSFAADALDSGADESFKAYVAFMTAFFERRGGSAGALRDTLGRLSRDPAAPPELGALLARTVPA